MNIYSQDLSGHIWWGLGGCVVDRHTGKGQGYGWSRMFYFINSYSEQVNCPEHFMCANSPNPCDKSQEDFLPVSLFTMNRICSRDYLDPGICLQDADLYL